jgi:hypothetical protein
MADITIRPQVKSLLPIMAGPAGERLSPVDHFSCLVLFLRDERKGMAFGTIESHSFHMGIMAEGDLPHPFHRVLDVTAPDLCEYNRR